MILAPTTTPNGVSIGRPPAKGWLSPGHSVTARAVAGDGEIPPPLDLAEILRVQARPDFVRLRASGRDQARRDDQRGDRDARDPAREELTHGREVPGS